VRTGPKRLLKLTIGPPVLEGLPEGCVRVIAVEIVGALMAGEARTMSAHVKMGLKEGYHAYK
jgi:hypothetical protein